MSEIPQSLIVGNDQQNILPDLLCLCGDRPEECDKGCDREKTMDQLAPGFHCNGAGSKSQSSPISSIRKHWRRIRKVPLVSIRKLPI